MTVLKCAVCGKILTPKEAIHHVHDLQEFIKESDETQNTNQVGEDVELGILPSCL